MGSFSILHFSVGIKQNKESGWILQCDWENCEHLKYVRNVIVLQKKSQLGMRKLNHKQEHLVWGFVASSLVLILAVIDHNTINITEIFHAVKL